MRSITILLSHSCNKGESWNKKAKWKEKDDFPPSAGPGKGTQWELNSLVQPNWVVSGSTRGTEVRIRLVCLYLCTQITVKKAVCWQWAELWAPFDASWINGKGASVCPGEMHADCLQASPWLILGNFRLKCSFSFCSSVGPEIKCQILTLPQPANLVICKTQMQTLSLQLHLRSWQTQANWCCLAFSSPSLCSFAFFSSHSLTYPLLLETLLEICVLHGPAFQKEDVSCRAYSFQSKLFLVPKLHSHPMSASTPDAQNLTTSQWEGGMSCFRWGLPFSSLAWWLLRNSGSSPVRNIRGKFLVPKVFFQNVEGSPGRVQPDFKWKCLLSASFTISLQLEITK